ncbi:MAG: isoprenylcysteine carboxylmethyltransferase family protein [Synergistaceae bacterium]|nr:isoprenylcysteine carboxylmethyltransferase family protein [Synergistaceae bacterium]
MMVRISKKISSLAFKYRGLFWGIFAAGILVFPGEFDAVRFILGLMILVSGQLLRFWAAGCIPKYRTEVIGAPVLVTWGPYKWVRNPLYAGNAIMGIGWAFMVGWGWVIAFIIAFFILYCLMIIPAEEEFLESKFGEKYRIYKEKVPSLFPFPRNGFPSGSNGERCFNAKIARSEEIYSIRINFLVTAVVIARLLFVK